MSDAQARRRPSWGRLGEELRRLRRRAGLGQDAMAQAVGVHRSTIERIETGGAHGGSPPSVQAVMDWAAACEVANPDLAVLRALAESALDEHRPYRQWGTLATLQEGIRADEASARALRNFNTWGVPGLLQTARYARALAEMADSAYLGQVAEGVAVKMRRQAILDEPGRRFEFVLTEPGLRWRVGSVAVHQSQLSHLAAAATEPQVTLGVIPLTARLQVSPVAGFVIYEDRDGAAPFVAVETPHGRTEANAPADVAFYQQVFALLAGGALYGDEARALILAAAAALR